MARYGTSLNRPPKFDGHNYLDPADLPLNKSLYPPAAAAKPFFGLTPIIPFQSLSYQDRNSWSDNGLLPTLPTTAMELADAIGVIQYLGATLAPFSNPFIPAPFNAFTYRDSFFDGSAFLPKLIQGKVQSQLGAPFNSMSYRDSADYNNAILSPPPGITPFINTWILKVLP